MENLVGAPTEKYADAGGGQTWEYNLLPEGRQIYMVSFGADGRLMSVRQTMTEANFHDIYPGESSRDDILRLLGKPSGRYLISRVDEEVWQYQFYSDAWRMLLHVYFPVGDGAVKRYATMLDASHHRSRRR